MKVCGVDLKGNDAIVCLMTLNDGLYSLPDCRVKRLTINNAADGEQLAKFQFDFTQLMKDYQIEHIVIRERMTKGKFAGGAASFKLEAAIQLMADAQVSLLSSAKTKEILKNSRVVMNFNDTELKQFQELAFLTAFAYLDSNPYLA